MAQRLYRIGDAAELLGLKTYVLRYWETEFSQLRPVRTGKGQRRYTEADVAMLGHIRYLLHDQGMTIEGARRVLAGESALSLKDALPSDSPSTPLAGAAPEPVVVAPAPDVPPEAEIQVQPVLPEREKRPGKSVQLSFDACLAARERTAGTSGQERSVPQEDSRSATIRHIAEELRALRRLLRQN